MSLPSGNKEAIRHTNTREVRKTESSNSRGNQLVDMKRSQTIVVRCLSEIRARDLICKKESFLLEIRLYLTSAIDNRMRPQYSVERLSSLLYFIDIWIPNSILAYLKFCATPSVPLSRVGCEIDARVSVEAQTGRCCDLTQGLRVQS